jgi:hypothetical protein
VRILGEQGDQAGIERVDGLSKSHAQIVITEPAKAQGGAQTDQPHGMPLRTLPPTRTLDP